ncbi:MAG: polyphosphate kinase 2 family protein [Chloroflexales bacterium]|nr:polyphosphate kinase 2 family protein [Chloroflexales bacterium]
MPRLFRVDPGSSVKLPDYDTRHDDDLSKDQGQEQFDALAKELGELQELLYAAGSHSVLILLQGMDTSGKDGTIRNVLRDVNPAGCQVTSFKVPTAEELAHDFLWRVHRHTPGKGQLGVFNRSHYEDVLVVRVHKLATDQTIEQRFDQINAFERLLTENNTIVLKFFLHISKKEQEERLLAREQDVTKAWKLSPGDWRERALWDDYQRAYEDALVRCSTAQAPWHIVPADRKWFRNLAITEAVVKALRENKPQWDAELDKRAKTAHAELKAMRAAQQ